MSKKELSTRAVRDGQHRTASREHSDPIFLTSSFVFDSAEHASMLFGEKIEGNIYSRFTNPTAAAFQERLASLENAKFCIATASGMSAILTLCLCLLKSGDHIVATRGLFGSTVNLFNNILSRFNIGTTYLDPKSIESWPQLVTENVKLIFVETPSNPLFDIVDIQKLAATITNNDCYLAVDNCFCSPVLQQPLALGADVVVHSATKFLDGHGRGMGGALVTNDKKLDDLFYGFLRTAGPTISPFNAWMFYIGLETLAVRIKQSSASAFKIAHWLNEHPSVKRVYYPGLKDHPGHELVQRQQSDFGALLSFEIKGGQSAAWSFIDALEIFSKTANFGDTKSTVTHPASTTHSRITKKERSSMGVSDSLIRICIGLEELDDLIFDLSTAFGQLEENLNDKDV